VDNTGHVWWLRLRRGIKGTFGWCPPKGLGVSSDGRGSAVREPSAARALSPARYLSLFRVAEVPYLLHLASAASFSHFLTKRSGEQITPLQNMLQVLNNPKSSKREGQWATPDLGKDIRCPELVCGDPDLI
jgi:hypothetical protein